MKKSINTFLVFSILTIAVFAVCVRAWAGGGHDVNTNPFDPTGTQTYQGFSLLKIQYQAEGSSGDEYYVYPIYGANPSDGVGTLYYIRPDNGQRYISNKDYDFLTANGVPYDSSSKQFNLWPVYTYNNFPFILTAGVQGNGNYLMKTPYPYGALDLQHGPAANAQEIIYYWSNDTWLINPEETIPSTGKGAAPGWITTLTFIPPDLQAQSVNSGASVTGAIVGSTYYASAHFYMNYEMLGYSNVRIYQFRNDGTGTLLAQQTACFGKYGSFDLNGVAWTMDSSTTSIVASVGERWDNTTRSWIKEGYSNADVAWSGNNADNNWSNNIATTSVIVGQPPQPPGGGGTNNLVADSVTWDSTQNIATAKFHSTFNVGGTVTVRFYSDNGGSSLSQCGDPQTYHISANGSLSATLTNYFVPAGATLYATIDLTFNGSSWNGSKFASDSGSQDETTYEDNKTSCVAGVVPPPPPGGGGSSDEVHPSSYHPVIQVPRYKTVTYQEWEDNWVSGPYIPDNSKPKIHVYLISLLDKLGFGYFYPPEAEASDRAYTYVTINGNSVYGYWLDANGMQIFIECDQDGKGIRFWINKGSFVTKTKQILDGYDVKQDTTRTNYLYASECWYSPEWKGTYSLDHAYNFQSVTPLAVTTPYGNNLPDTWRWIVFNYQNVNSWPVMANILEDLGSAGERYSGLKYLGPGETKQLLLRLNSTTPVATGNKIATWSNVATNYDPEAPASFVTNPPADDGTGTTWTAHFYQGVTISPNQQSAYWSKGVWGLVPAFKEIPVWSPEPGDSHWGTLSIQVVPAWKWTIVGGVWATHNNIVSTNLTNAPYVVPGSYGATQYTPPSGVPYSSVFEFDYLVKGSNLLSQGTVLATNLNNFLNQKWGSVTQVRWDYDLFGNPTLGYSNNGKYEYLSQNQQSFIITVPNYSDLTQVKMVRV